MVALVQRHGFGRGSETTPKPWVRNLTETAMKLRQNRLKPRAPKPRNHPLKGRRNGFALARGNTLCPRTLRFALRGYAYGALR
jgi:hypothetical protein